MSENTLYAIFWTVVASMILGIVITVHSYGLEAEKERTLQEKYKLEARQLYKKEVSK